MKKLYTKIDEFIKENVEHQTISSEKLKEFFEENEFSVYEYEQDGETCAELEKWTNRGVDMIISLIPFTKEEFISYVNDFDIDEEIEIHRQDPKYKKDFTITQSVTDFTKFHEHLKEVADKLINSFV